MELTPKEKAKELFDDYYWELENDYKAKQCALKAVNEILNFMLIQLKWDEKYNGNVIYWKEVKEEIELL